MQKLGLPAHEFALITNIAIRFLPILAEEAERLMKAQASRGADFSHGRYNFIQRTRSLLPLLVPLFLASLQRAENLIEAMEAAGVVTEMGTNGQRDGKFWMPAEADVSIRPGWFYHPAQDSRVRSPENLVDLFYVSIGRGASWLLNLPPDRRGQIHENDERSLRGFKDLLDATFAEDLAQLAQFGGGLFPVLGFDFGIVEGERVADEAHLDQASQ